MDILAGWSSSQWQKPFEMELYLWAISRHKEIGGCKHEVTCILLKAVVSFLNNPPGKTLQNQFKCVLNPPESVKMCFKPSRISLNML